MGVKDERLLEGQLGRGEFARFETPIEQAGNSQCCNFKLQTPNPKKKRILMVGVGVEKRTPEWFLPFGTCRTEKSVQKALTKR